MTDNRDQNRFRVLDLELDLARRQVSRQGEPLQLPDLSFRLLATLVEAAPHAVDKDALIEKVWDGVVVSDETLSQRVRLLRQALGEEGSEPRYITAVRGRGYRLICPVTAAGKPAARWWRWAVAGAAALVAVVIVQLQRDAPPGAFDSIAVLPFTDLSPDGDHRYFADGMQEELLIRLARFERLQVASRTSVERYRHTDLPLPAIAGELGVDAIIESSVRVAGRRVRISVQLIDAASDRHLWAGSYDRELSVDTLFAIQQEVSTRIGEALLLTLDQPARQPPTRSLEAYDNFLLGTYHTYRQSPQDLAIAIDRLSSAVAIDESFAEAWVNLGRAYSFAGTRYGHRPPSEVHPLAEAAVMKALAIDDSLAEAHSLHADILTWYDWDFEAAEGEYRRTLELDPLNVLGYALFLSIHQRHEEAAALIEQRIEATPRDPYVHINAAWIFLRAGDDARALAEAQLAGDHPDSVSVRAAVLRRRGEPERAAALLEQAIRQRGRNPNHVSELAVARAEAGDDESARALLAELESVATQHYLSPDLPADIHLALGDTDSALAGYAQALADRTRAAIFLQSNRQFDDLRKDPRYLALVERVGLPQHPPPR